MKNSTVIYTAISGNYDKLMEPNVISPGCDYVCFSDKNIKSKVWVSRRFDEKFNDPTLTAKKIKILPHRYLSEYESSVWVDGNILIKDDINHLLKKSLNKKSLAFFNHPEYRKTLKDELNKCITLKKDDKKIMKKQVLHYYKLGYTDQASVLPACYIIFRKHNDKKITKTMEEWWAQILSHSRRDQLSFPYIAWKYYLDYTLLDHDKHFSKYFERKKHRVSLIKSLIKGVKKLFK